MCGTVLVETALTICAPRFIMLACSAAEPTMKLVTLCRKIMGVVLIGRRCQGLSEVYRGKDKNVLLVTYLDKLCAFYCFIRVNYGCLVCDNANTIAYASISPRVCIL
jgi:hypothetical protein